MTCLHDRFEATVDVNRETIDGNVTTGYTLTVKVQCAVCGKKFQFGDPPRRSPNGLAMAVPIVPVVPRPPNGYNSPTTTTSRPW